jgi:iron complex outermembrane receptor protein
VKEINISYNYLDQNIDQVENIQSRYALEHIQNQFILRLDMVIFGKLKNSFNVRYIDRVEQNPYFLIDDRLLYEFNKGSSIFLEATNLTNQTYTEVMTPMPGIWIRGGLKLEIDY